METGNKRKCNINIGITDSKKGVCQTQKSYTNKMTKQDWTKYTDINYCQADLKSKCRQYSVSCRGTQSMNTGGHSTLHSFKVNERFGWCNRCIPLCFATATEDTAHSVVIDRQTSRHGNCWPSLCAVPQSNKVSSLLFTALLRLLIFGQQR